MLQRAVFWGGLLLNVQYTSAAATWKTPTTGADLKANTQDSVWLDWTSDYPAPVLRMLCKDVANGGNLVTVSHFVVDHNGPFEYIMDSFMEPNKMKYPLSCHAQLAKDDADTAGLDCPVGIVWSYDASKAMKTVSAIQAATAAPTTAKSQAASTPTPVVSASTTGSPSKVIAPPSVAEKSTTESPSQVTTVPPSTAKKSTTDLPSQSTTPPSNTDKSTTDSSSQSTANPSSSTDKPSTSSKGSSASDSGASTAPVATTSSSSNNTGAIVGGVVGGIAVISFIIFGLLFLRRQKRNRTSFAPVTNNESSIWNFYFFNTQKRREQKIASGPVYEKEGSGMARELEANAAGGKGNQAAPYDPVELPVGSDYRR
ncbi:hypothetical protein VE00_00029 [Pseudogymnoascus sp. WSF 3629]|nr:hypothetical protein VE00_00029 [Pseudogymnoascus sp. WSF 3629]